MKLNIEPLFVFLLRFEIEYVVYKSFVKTIRSMSKVVIYIPSLTLFMDTIIFKF